jgi:hypothetical protein
MAALTGPARRGERGQVLLLVTVLGLLAMGLWLLAWRSTHDAIRMERIAVQRAIRAGSAQAALAQGLDLLASGRPPTDPFVCQTTMTSGADSFACAVSYVSQGSPDEWLVRARLATDDEQAELPAMPGSF